MRRIGAAGRVKSLGLRRSERYRLPTVRRAMTFVPRPGTRGVSSCTAGLSIGALALSAFANAAYSYLTTGSLGALAALFGLGFGCVFALAVVWIALAPEVSTVAAIQSA